jgi:hypothetical protein
MNFIQRIKENFSKVTPLPTGLHHLQAMGRDEKPFRIHLRLREDGTGILIVNAATILHLNPTAAECAYHYIKGTTPEEAARQIAARYRVKQETILQDYNDFVDRIQTVLSTPDLDPVSYLDFERISPHSTDLTAPFRIDCALTYRLPPGERAEVAPVKRVDRELSTEEWQTILDQAWRAGIPHVTFTGGEPTLREDLPALIAHAEKNGQVCGLLTDGLKLADPEYLQILLQTGLDHVLLLLQPGEGKSWQALERLMPEDLFVTVHITLNAQNANDMPATLKRLAGLGVRNISASIIDMSLRPELEKLSRMAAELDLTMRFDLPVPYSEQNPVALETEFDSVPPGAGNAWLYVEPDGDVLPAQGMAEHILGNFLTDKWETIYSH